MSELSLLTKFNCKRLKGEIEKVERERERDSRNNPHLLERWELLINPMVQLCSCPLDYHFTLGFIISSPHFPSMETLKFIVPLQGISTVLCLGFSKGPHLPFYSDCPLSQAPEVYQGVGESWPWVEVQPEIIARPFALSLAHYKGPSCSSLSAVHILFW